MVSGDGRGWLIAFRFCRRLLPRRTPVDRLVDLDPVDGHVLGGHNAQPDLVPANLDHGDDDVVVDDNRLVLLSTQNKHGTSSNSC